MCLLFLFAAEWKPTGLPKTTFTVPLDQAELLEEPRAGSIAVSVTDSGAGLSEQQLAEICSEGVQFNANQLQAGQGSGLGLFISKGLAEQHGGTLTVTSEGLGKGSTFTMELPLFKVEQEMTHFGSLRIKPSSVRDSNKFKIGAGNADNSGGADDSSLKMGDHSRRNSADRTHAVRRQKRVMVVDDAMSNRKLLIRILLAKGYLCDGAEDGQQAVDLYTDLRKRGEIVDAILMDYEMPVMDGPTACKRIRELGCNCFIAGVTGNVLPADIDHFKKHGANAVIAKPLNVDVFESLFVVFKSVPDSDPAHLTPQVEKTMDDMENGAK